MMSNGPPPARLDDIDDARWLFPQEQAPPPRNEGYKKNGFGDPALQLPAYPQPSLEVVLTVERVDFFSHPRHDGEDSAH